MILLGIRLLVGGTTPYIASFDVTVSRIDDTETTKYIFPEVITNSQMVIIKIVLGSNATWTFNGKEYK